MKIKYLLVLVIVGLGLQNAHSQDLTGLWVSITLPDSPYYEELYIIHNEGNNYAGHSYDVTIREDFINKELMKNASPNGYCRHWFDAFYVAEDQMFYALVMSVISSSVDHAPSDYKLRYEKGENGREYLVGTTMVYPYQVRKSNILMPDKDVFNRRRMFETFGERATPVKFVKVSTDYKIYDEAMPLAMNKEEMALEKARFPEVYEEDLLLEKEQKGESIAGLSTPDISMGDDRNLESVDNPGYEGNLTTVDDLIGGDPITSDATESDPSTPETTENDVIASVAPEIIETPIAVDIPEVIVQAPEIIVPKPEVTITEKRNARTDQLLSHLRLKSNDITLLIRDYGTVDNDSVTIFYNDKIIAENMRITEKAAEFNLSLDPTKRNELVFVANNLGDVPPNTARITLISDGKRYNYKLFTDEKNNALILLENITN